MAKSPVRFRWTHRNDPYLFQSVAYPLKYRLLEMNEYLDATEEEIEACEVYTVYSRNELIVQVGNSGMVLEAVKDAS